VGERLDLVTRGRLGTRFRSVFSLMDSAALRTSRSGSSARPARKYAPTPAPITPNSDTSSMMSCRSRTVPYTPLRSRARYSTRLDCTTRLST
jgi:hypothetical protein